MTHLALTLLLSAAPPAPWLAAAPDEDAPPAQTAPAPRWPGGIVMGLGGGAMTIGAFFAVVGLFTFDCGTPCPSQDNNYRDAAIIASIGFTALIGGILWIIWAHPPEP